jgi:hypothetical protein
MGFSRIDHQQVQATGVGIGQGSGHRERDPPPPAGSRMYCASTAALSVPRWQRVDEA